mmetsp:Transcript_64759/g.159389  ORF Transcript_64759/g.159389 Transcript_64759/m.159389 type:complete len:1083 (-) Transcript_64759:8-3256(-)
MKWKSDWKGALKSGDGRYARGAGPFDGQWKHSYRHGIGTQLWDCGSLIGCMYEGEWRDGKANGQGTFTFVDGSLFECEWRDGVMNGQAQCTLADGSTFRGRFEDGRPNGPGVWRNELETLEADFVQGTPTEGSISDAEGAAGSLDPKSREKWKFRLMFDLSDAEWRQLHRPNPILNPAEWRATRARELGGLAPAHVNRLCLAYGVNVGNNEDGEPVLPFPQICNGLAKAMWDRVPSAELISHARDQLAKSERNPLKEQDRIEAKFEAFMDEVIEEDEELRDAGVMAVYTNAESVTRESLASTQNPQYLGNVLLGRACAIDPSKGIAGGIHLDLTSPPSKPGDLAYCASPSCESPGAHVRNQRFNGSISHPHYSKRVAQRLYPSFGQVQRYAGHSLWNVSAGEVPQQCGAPKAVPPLNSHDLSMNSHVPTFVGETTNEEGLTRARIGYQDWREKHTSLLQSRYAPSPPHPPSSGNASSPSKQHSRGAQPNLDDSLPSIGRSATTENVTGAKAHGSPSVLGGSTSPRRNRAQDHVSASVQSGVSQLSSANKMLFRAGDLPRRGSVRGFATSQPEDESHHEPINMNIEYDMSILGELKYRDVAKRPLVEWQSINDALGGILRPYYGEEADFTTARPPYSQGPAALPPSRPNKIATAEQLVFTLGLKESNTVLPMVRSLNISGHALPSLPDRIASMSSLEAFKASNNNLTRLPDSFVVFTKLKSLKLSNNPRLCGEMPFQILKLTRLEELYMCSTGLTSLTSAIENLSRMQRLDISRNALRTLPLPSLANMKTLLLLDVGGNPISPDDMICGVPKEIVQQRGSTSFVLVDKKADPSRMSTSSFSSKRPPPQRAGYWVPLGILGYLRHSFRCYQSSGGWEDVKEYKGEDTAIKFTSEMIKLARFLPAEHYQIVLNVPSKSEAEDVPNNERAPAEAARNANVRYVHVSPRLEYLFSLMAPNAKVDPGDGVTCGALLKTLNGTNLIRTKLENVLAFVEKYRSYSKDPEAAHEHAPVSRRKSMAAAEKKSASMDEQNRRASVINKAKVVAESMKVEAVADFWGGGSMYKMEIECFQSVMCMIMVDVQRRE